ncbi:MAG: FAD:protein FMN transferase [Verrucomicrobiae bacterium]|nr:FAD:protein FMN transferase [Verrucomicrobiae bacterium]
MTPRSRRQFISALSAGGIGGFLSCFSNGPGFVSGTSEAFGTSVSLTIIPPPEVDPHPLLDLAFAEIERLEAIFSLFEPLSPLRRLNDQGFLNAPPPELITVLALSDQIHNLTQGAFDPTVQSLWELYESHFATHPTDEVGPPDEAIAEARRRVDWKAVRFDSSEIRFSKPGLKLTLNGIAPGFAADRVADLLMAKGVEHALIDCGEFRAIGDQGNGAPWPVEIRGPEAVGTVGQATLEGNALATSAGYATAFDLEERFHHLFHPSRTSFQPASRVISVEAPTAGFADALATAGGVMEWGDFQTVAKALPGVKVTRFEAD